MQLWSQKLLLQCNWIDIQPRNKQKRMEDDVTAANSTNSSLPSLLGCRTQNCTYCFLSFFLQVQFRKNAVWKKICLLVIGRMYSCKISQDADQTQPAPRHPARQLHRWGSAASGCVSVCMPVWCVGANAYVHSPALPRQRRECENTTPS